MLFALGILDKIAFDYYLYWHWSWFDMVMHLLGGLAIGLLVSYFYLSWKSTETLEGQNWRNLLYWNFSLAVLLSGFWEIFEAVTGRTIHFNWLEMLKDLLTGILGGLLAGLIYHLFILWSRRQTLKK